MRMMHVRAAHRQAGISIVEIAVSLAVLSLALGLVVPSASVWMANARIRSSAESLLAGLQQARNEAVRRNRDVSFWLVSEPTTGQIDATCALASSSRSWVVSGTSPAGLCESEPSVSVAPMLVTKAAGGHSGAGINASGTDAALNAATNVRFNGFGQMAGTVGGEAPLAQIDIDNGVTGNDFRPLRIQIRGSQIRLCEPRVSAVDDPRRCT